MSLKFRSPTIPPSINEITVSNIETPVTRSWLPMKWQLSPTSARLANSVSKPSSSIPRTTVSVTPRHVITNPRKCPSKMFPKEDKVLIKRASMRAETIGYFPPPKNFTLKEMVWTPYLEMSSSINTKLARVPLKPFQRSCEFLRFFPLPIRSPVSIYSYGLD